MIRYSCNGCYDIIEEVDEQAKAREVLPRLRPRQGTCTLPTPGYSGLIHDEPQPNTTDIDAVTEDTLSSCLKIIDDFLKSSAGNIAVDTLQREDLNGKRKTSPYSYIELASKSYNGIEEDNDEIPSAYLTLTDDTLQ